jgi:hypothetical protein
MSDTNYRVEPGRITIHPHWGTGWQTVLNHPRQEIVMQPCFLWFKLPLRRKVPYSQVAQVATACKQVRNPIDTLFALYAMRDMYTPETRMPIRERRYDILMAVKGGKKFIKLGTLKSPDTASNLVEECRRRLGLSET